MNRLDRCNYLADGKTKSSACNQPALCRNEHEARCQNHGGHLDFTERLIDGQWQPWQPIHVEGGEK